jgi:hypothetical protein
MKLRFSIRDLLWLILVVALIVGWRIDHVPQRYSVEFENSYRGNVRVLTDNQTGEAWYIGDGSR